MYFFSPLANSDFNGLSGSDWKKNWDDLNLFHCTDFMISGLISAYILYGILSPQLHACCVSNKLNLQNFVF